MMIDHTFCVAVGGVMVLKNAYSQDQSWLPFIVAVFPKKEQEAEVLEAKNYGNLTFRVPQENVPQYSLPFATALKVTKSQRKHLTKTQFPSFDRTLSGKLLMLKPKLRSPNSNRIAVNNWCNANLRGLYVPNNVYIFELTDDYMLALLGPHFEKHDG